jgi:hypothetical protein
MKLCTRCILPETFPGIHFDDHGLCSHCQREGLASASEKTEMKKAQYRDRLDRLISGIKGSGPAYDAILAYSGGKDSSYTLKILQDRYDLRLLAFTFDNHFVSQRSWDNIKNVCEAAGADHIAVRPPWRIMKRVFCLTAAEDIFPAPTLVRASAMCTACIGLVKSLVVKIALDMNIPMVVFGWSPGQAPIQSGLMKTNPSFVFQNQGVWHKAFPPHIDEGVRRYLIPETYCELYKDRFPWSIHPLAFFDYREEEMEHELRTVGWVAPGDTGENSTNCLLNAFASQCHISRHGFHPYVLEIANLVRQGLMPRERGLGKIYGGQDPTLVAYAKERLGL